MRVCLWWSWVTPGSVKARVEGDWQGGVVGRPVRTRPGVTVTGRCRSDLRYVTGYIFHVTVIWL